MSDIKPVLRGKDKGKYYTPDMKIGTHAECVDHQQKKKK